VSLDITQPEVRREPGGTQSDLDYVPSSTLRYALRHGEEGYGTPGDDPADQIDDH
jgi:hypothetical protein